MPSKQDKEELARIREWLRRPASRRKAAGSSARRPAKLEETHEGLRQFFWRLAKAEWGHHTPLSKQEIEEIDTIIRRLSRVDLLEAIEGIFPGSLAKLLEGSWPERLPYSSPPPVRQPPSPGPWVAESPTVAYEVDGDQAEFLDAMREFIRAELQEREPFECVVASSPEDEARLGQFGEFVETEALTTFELLEKTDE